MDQIKWYESTTLRALLLAFVSQVIVWTGVADKLPDGAATLAVDALLQVVAIAATGYAAWARANNANPPVTNAAVRKVEAIAEAQAAEATKSSQSGFARSGLLAALVAIGTVGLAVPVVLNVQGCVPFGVQQPKTFNENVAYALAQNAAIREAATVSLESGQLTVDDAEYVLELTDRSRTLIDTARLAYTGGDVATAEGRMQLVLGVLTQLQSYLNAKGVK